MRFEAKPWPSDDEQGRAILLLNDQLEALCCLAVPEDTVTDWHGAWRKLAQEDALQVDRLLANAEDIFQVDLADCPRAVTRTLYGLVEFLQTVPAQALPNRKVGAKAIKDFLDGHVCFGRSQESESPGIRVIIKGQTCCRLRTNPTLTENWLAAFLKWAEEEEQSHSPHHPDFVRSAIESYEFLYAAARIQQDHHVLKSFVAFSRALAERLERDDRYQPYRRRLEDVYRAIVCHEDKLDIARDSLLNLLQIQRPPIEKWQGLSRLIHDLKTRRSESHKTTNDEDERLAALTGLIADHYLDKYDLPCAVTAWKQLELKDLLFGALLALLERSHLALALHTLAFLVLTVLALLQSHGWSPCVYGLSLVPLIGGLTLLTLFLGPLLAGLGVIRNRRNLHYGQLFLPRMLGAIIVGLSVLMVDDFPWKIALQISGPALLLIPGIYFLSYLYIRSDVYQTIKFEPWSERACGTSQSRTQQGSANSTPAYAARIAFQVFAVGIVQSFLVTLFVSGLLFPVISKDPGFPSWERSSLGGISFGSGTEAEAIFVFVPTLVLLWTGLALFIGAFVQLLWQERHVTSPVSE